MYQVVRFEANRNAKLTSQEHQADSNEFDGTKKDPPHRMTSGREHAGASLNLGIARYSAGLYPARCVLVCAYSANLDL
ncbi:MAG: hypothetical protein JNK57_15065 [Planctomycetaceae bacterium]|nr:hypothetical protein [Planctomycetaceae bacterium]